MNSVIDLLKSHASIRKFTEQKIDEALFEDLVRAGQGAATSSFLQGATIIRVRSDFAWDILISNPKRNLACRSMLWSRTRFTATAMMQWRLPNMTGKCRNTMGPGPVEGMERSGPNKLQISWRGRTGLTCAGFLLNRDLRSNRPSSLRVKLPDHSTGRQALDDDGERNNDIGHHQDCVPLLTEG